MKNTVHRSLASVLVFALLAITACNDNDLLSAPRRRPGLVAREAVSAGGLSVLAPGDINAAGTIVGYYQAGWWQPCPECGDPPTAINHAAIDVGGTMYDLGIGDWSATSFASGINDRGQVVGGVDEGNGYDKAFLWTPDTPNGTTGTMQRLADSPSGAAFANEINDAGQVVGIDYYAGTALLWSGGQVVELRSPIEGGSSNANDINAYGQIALGASDANGQWHPMLWTPTTPNGTTGHYVDLCPTCDGLARGINDFGQVTLGAYLFTPSSPNGSTGTLTELVGPYGVMQTWGVNNRGDVVGFMTVPFDVNQSVTHAFLWRPTEPNGTSGIFTDLTPELQPNGSSGVGAWAYVVGEEQGGTLKITGWRNEVSQAYDQLWIVTELGLPARVVARAGAPVSANEGTSVQFDARGTSPYSNDLTFRWTFGDGTSGTGPTPTHTYADNGIYPATVVVTDAGGYTSTASTTATISNVAPTASLSAPPSVNQGMTFTLALTGATDVLADMGSLQFAFDCGDGAGLSAFNASATRSCPTSASGPRSAVGAVRDKDGGSSQYGVTVDVANVAPAVTIVSAPTTVKPPRRVDIQFRFTDPGPQDSPWTYTVSWGDGTTTAAASTLTQDTTLTASHQYPGLGSKSTAVYIISVRVSDRLGAAGVATTNLTITK